MLRMAHALRGSSPNRIDAVAKFAGTHLSGIINLVIPIL